MSTDDVDHVWRTNELNAAHDPEPHRRVAATVMDTKSVADAVVGAAVRPSSPRACVET